MKWNIDGLKDAKKQLKNIYDDIEDFRQRVISMKNKAGDMQGLLDMILGDLNQLTISIKKLRNWVDSKIEKIDQAESVLTGMNLGDVGSITASTTTMQTVISEITKKYGESEELNRLNDLYNQQREKNKEMHEYLKTGGSRTDAEFKKLRDEKSTIDSNVRQAEVASGNPVIVAISDNTTIQQLEQYIEKLTNDAKTLNKAIDAKRAANPNDPEINKMHQDWVDIINMRTDAQKQLEKRKGDAKEEQKTVTSSNTTTSTVTGTLAPAGTAADAVAAEKARLKAEINSLQQEKAALNAEIDRLKAEDPKKNKAKIQKKKEKWEAKKLLIEQKKNELAQYG